MARVIAGKVGYAVLCLLATVILVVAGYARNVVTQVDATGNGVTIPGSASVGAMNILVMGLESRTDYQGNELDHHMQVVLHSGSRGGQATNVLILIHIFAGGKRAVGFSIPRDDYVTFPQGYCPAGCYSEGKIDAAYDWAYNQYLNAHPGEDKADRFLHANQAGQQATIDTVESVTGVKVDHFIEVNLEGFYYLAQAFGGIEVCIKPAPASEEPAAGMPAGTNLTDYDPLTFTDNSGFSAYKDGYDKAKGGAQYLPLRPSQALAFVRSRDTLPGVDKGRTYRQQAVIDYVIYEMKHEGLYSSLSKLSALLNTASKYLIRDSGFNLFDFAPSMSALKGQNMSLTTLGFKTENNVPMLPGYPVPQDINVINDPVIQQTVQSAFYPGTHNPSPSSVTVDVYNGDPNASGLATNVSSDLASLGYKAGRVANASAQSQHVTPKTQVFYGSGADANAKQIGLEFGAVAEPLGSLPAGHVEVLIGSAVTLVPMGIGPASTAPPNTQSTGAQVIGPRAAAGATASPAASAASSAPPASSGGIPGESTKVAPNAPFGIPCVY